MCVCVCVGGWGGCAEHDWCTGVCAYPHRREQGSCVLPVEQIICIREIQTAWFVLPCIQLLKSFIKSMLCSCSSPATTSLLDSRKIYISVLQNSFLRIKYHCTAVLEANLFPTTMKCATEKPYLSFFQMHYVFKSVWAAWLCIC